MNQERADPQNVKKEEEQSSASEAGNSNGESMISNTKHPLLHAWTLWHYKNDPRLQWDANLVKVHTFRLVWFR